jgi:hypothetical protein
MHQCEKCLRADHGGNECHREGRVPFTRRHLRASSGKLKRRE